MMAMTTVSARPATDAGCTMGAAELGRPLRCTRLRMTENHGPVRTAVNRTSASPLTLSNFKTSFMQHQSRGVGLFHQLEIMGRDDDRCPQPVEFYEQAQQPVRHG